MVEELLQKIAMTVHMNSMKATGSMTRSMAMEKQPSGKEMMKKYTLGNTLKIKYMVRENMYTITATGTKAASKMVKNMEKDSIDSMTE